MIPTLQYRHKLLLFAFLNVADLFLVWQLWRQGGGQLLDEAHPIARHCLAAYGWIGFVAFQGALILFVSALFLIGSRFRPHFGEGGLSFLCFALSSVVVYRCCLAGMPSAQVEPPHSENKLSTRAAVSHPWQPVALSPMRYGHFLRFWADQLIGQRCTLAEATRRVQQLEKARDSRWLAHLHQAYGKEYSDEACLAANVLMHCGTRLTLDKDSSRARARAAALEAEFKTLYQAEVPPIFKMKISSLTKTNKSVPCSVFRNILLFSHGDISPASSRLAVLALATHSSGIIPVHVNPKR